MTLVAMGLTVVDAAVVAALENGLHPVRRTDSSTGIPWMATVVRLVSTLFLKAVSRLL